jgi:hypothetical protein
MRDSGSPEWQHSAGHRPAGYGGNHRHRPSGRRWLVPVGVVAVLALVAGLIAGVDLLTGWGRAPASSVGEPVTVHPVQGRTVPIPAMRQGRRPSVAWPAAGTGTAVITAARIAPSGSGQRKAARRPAEPTAGSARAGDLPVWIGPPSRSGGRAPAVRAYYRPSSQVARVKAVMAPQAADTALGVRGVVFSLARVDGSPASGRVHVSVDYTRFAAAYGGGYASRLRLVELPRCALTTPQSARCRKYATANDPQLPGLKQAYQWAVRVFGKPKNAAQEAARWTQACAEFRKACAGQWASVVGPFTASPALLNGWNMGTATLLGAGNLIAGVIFPNKLLNRWEQEQKLGEDLNVPTARPNDPAWGDIIRGNSTIKWAVLEDGDLVIMPKFVNGEEVPHSLLSGGEGVKAAGEADIAYVPGEPVFAIDITRHSGHFEPSEESLRLGVDAFADAGIAFDGFDDSGGGVVEDG